MRTDADALRQEIREVLAPDDTTTILLADPATIHRATQAWQPFHPRFAAPQRVDPTWHVSPSLSRSPQV